MKHLKMKHAKKKLITPMWKERLMLIVFSGNNNHHPYHASAIPPINMPEPTEPSVFNIYRIKKAPTN
jgi:hypothetical protein